MTRPTNKTPKSRVESNVSTSSGSPTSFPTICSYHSGPGHQGPGSRLLSGIVESRLYKQKMKVVDRYGQTRPTSK